ncbi:hypothetical protein [Flavobacterium sp.]|uniref:HYC_CC_PP family protein n=1 Tax=Flavobacterium sp. TaxID=239 RepID=UPI0025F17BBB|nr:hypothetical protein [Flavobacterium sp.]
MIFRKHISILLTVLLLVSNLGLAFNVHYCDDEVASITLSTIQSAQKAEQDCCGVVEKNSKCCNDKIIKAEIKADLIIVKSVSFDSDFIPNTSSYNHFIFVTKSNFKLKNCLNYYCDAHAPPLYLLYSQYTFYC